MILGVTGSLCTGKTTVSCFLAEKGAIVLDADEVVHHQMKKGNPGFEAIKFFFGDSITKNNGEIDRKRLAQKVFSNPEKLKKLCALLHPLVMEKFNKEIQEIHDRDSKAVIVLDVPLLLESGMMQEVDKIIVVTTTFENQVQRSKERLGLTEKEALQRIEAQMPLLEKTKGADFVISTSGSLDETKGQVEELWKRLKR